jgi:hypothetical protein
MRIKIFLVISLSTIFLNSIAQSYSSRDIRRITINYNDSIIETGVAINAGTIEADKDLIYFWYYSNTISANQGGYYGIPLHGPYSSFTKDKKLMEQGYFKNGLKNDTWIKWFGNGKIREVYNWKNGRLHGSHHAYSETGELLVKEVYRKGKKHGTQHYFLSDGTRAVSYRNGRIIKDPKNLNLMKRIIRQ